MKSIVALATPIGRGAVAIVRMSGDDCIDIAKKMFSPFPLAANMLQAGYVKLADGFQDRAMCVFFACPRSYTGEDSVEFHLHGGNALAKAVIECAVGFGARIALAGEFSKRAFINGKQNLSQAEGLVDLINAESRMQLSAAAILTQNKLGKKMEEMQTYLRESIASVEAAINYPEEDLEEASVDDCLFAIIKTKDQLKKLLNTAKLGGILSNGVKVVLCGRVNVGKSSLLNSLLGQDRVIVSAIEGTTRDIVSEAIEYKGLLIRFFDTAGIRQTEQEIEKEGIARTIQAIKNADIILDVSDGEGQEGVAEQMAGQGCEIGGLVIKVRSKCDLADQMRQEGIIYTSAKTGEGIEQLKEEIYKAVQANQADQNQLLLSNTRHIDAITRCVRQLEVAQKAIENCDDIDCVSYEMTVAWEILGEITGETARESIIDTIYKNFCVGK